jgi:hypothetical protein
VTVTDGDGKPMRERVSALARRSPQQYGLLEAHVDAITRAIERCDRHYPTARQVYDEIEDPSIGPTTVGYLLTILSDLDVVTIHTESGAANRYDLTRVPDGALSELERLLEERRERD